MQQPMTCWPRSPARSPAAVIELPPQTFAALGLDTADVEHALNASTSTDTASSRSDSGRGIGGGASPPSSGNRRDAHRDGEGEVMASSAEMSAAGTASPSTEGKAKGEKADGGDSSSGGGDGDADWTRNIWAPPNRAIVASYFCVGLANSFLSTPLSYYMVHEIDASPAEQNVVITLIALPWSFKLAYGFVSDNFPIRGKRRKPYFIGGWAIFSLGNLLLAAMGRPSVQALAGLLFLAVCSFMMSDVVTDAIIVERSQNEPEQQRGTMQATGYAARFVGSFLGSVLGTIVYNKEQWGWGLSIAAIFLINGALPLLVVGPFMWSLRDAGRVRTQGSKLAALKAQCKTIHSTLSLRSVYVPMTFVYIYNLFQVPNAAWGSFLIAGLNFSNWELGLLTIIGSAFSAGGLLMYKRCCMHASWRKVYLVTALLLGAFSVLQLLLILRVNQKLGIGDLAFAVGDDALAEFVVAIQFLPVAQMYICMCPEGTEGTTYALLTTLSNVAGSVASSIGTLMTHIWNVSNDAFREGYFGGMWRLTVLTSIMQLLPLVLLRLLPANAEQQRAMQANTTTNRWGGTIFACVFFASLAWSVIESIVVIS